MLRQRLDGVDKVMADELVESNATENEIAAIKRV
jgi:hypothetical protein